MQQEVRPKFINYLKILIKESGVSTRELSTAVNRSSSYVSQLLTGKIKKIDFKTALIILSTISKKYPLSTSVEGIEKILIEQFNILPDEVIFERYEQAEKQEEERKKKLEIMKQTYLHIASTYNNKQMDLLINICKLDLIMDNSDMFFKMLLELIKDEEKFKLLFLFTHYLYVTNGNDKLISLSDSEQILIPKFKELLKGDG